MIVSPKSRTVTIFGSCYTGCRGLVAHISSFYKPKSPPLTATHTAKKNDTNLRYITFIGGATSDEGWLPASEVRYNSRGYRRAVLLSHKQ